MMRTAKEFKQGEAFVVKKTLLENAWSTRAPHASVGSICILLNDIKQMETLSSPFFSWMFGTNKKCFSIISDELEDYFECL
jgi:hypothetical protein